jgi:hypothetical protein
VRSDFGGEAFRKPDEHRLSGAVAREIGEVRDARDRVNDPAFAACDHAWQDAAARSPDCGAGAKRYIEGLRKAGVPEE